jgi:hypothetical protein
MEIEVSFYYGVDPQWNTLLLLSPLADFALTMIPRVVVAVSVGNWGFLSGAIGVLVP